MVGVHPVSEAQDNEFSYDGVVCIDRVPATGVVAVRPAALVQHVIHTVFETLHGERRALGVAFCCVVEYHVENDFDTCCMKSPYHFF